MPFKILLVTVLLMLGLLAAMAFMEPINGLTGIGHPEYAYMKIGPDTVGMHSHTKWMSFGFAMVLIGMFVTLLNIGSRRNEKQTGLAKWIYAFGIVYTLIFIGMITSNWNYVASDSNTFWGQMPRPTAWMIYAVWLSPLIVALSYVFTFEKNVIRITTMD